jgi:protein-disulfide isomerase
MENQEKTITFNLKNFYSAMLLLAFVMGGLIGFAIGNSQVDAGTNDSDDTQYIRYNITTEGYPRLGPADAPITIVAFSDFQCPFCKRFHDTTYQALLAEYPNQIRFVYRNFPLTSIHPEAKPSAVASLCANEQNAYWEYTKNYSVVN